MEKDSGEKGEVRGRKHGRADSFRLYSFREEEMHSNMKFGEAVLPHAETMPHHQMVFERPARDSSFPIGVREAERLPPDDSS